MDKWCVTDGVVVDRDVHVIDNGHSSTYHRRMDGQTDGRTDGWTDSMKYYLFECQTSKSTGFFAPSVVTLPHVSVAN